MLHRLCPLILTPVPWSETSCFPFSSASGMDSLPHFIPPPEVTSPFTLNRGYGGDWLFETLLYGEKNDTLV